MRPESSQRSKIRNILDAIKLIWKFDRRSLFSHIILKSANFVKKIKILPKK